MPEISISNGVFDYSELNFEIYLKFGFCFLVFI